MSIRVCRSPSEVVAAVPPLAPAVVDEARAEADLRPIDYALGSGEADEVALFAGIKPLVRQVVPTVTLKDSRARFEALGLATAWTAHRAKQATTQGTVLFVGRDPRLVREAATCEDRAEHDRDLGRLLGYPRCCVEAYLEVPSRRRNLDAIARAFARSPSRVSPRLNCLDLAVFHYVSWLPCSFDCELSRVFADAVANHIARHHGQFVARPGQAAREWGATTCPPGCRHERFVASLDEALAAHRLVVLQDVQVSIVGPYLQGEVRVRRAWPTARDRHPSALLGSEAREAVARVTALVQTRGTVSVDRGNVYIGGEAVLRSEDALLVPFGAFGPDPSPR
jgi:hypothetical protein